MAKKNVEEQAESKVTGNQVLKGILKDNKDSHLNFQERVEWKVSTGSLLLDSATKMMGPSLVRVCGGPNQGKSPQTLEFVRNFLQMKNTKCLYVRSEGRLSEENVNRCGLKFVTNPDEWEDGTVFVLETNVYDLVIQTVKELVLNNPEGKLYVFCIDSMDALVPKQDLDRKPEEAYKVAGPQVMSKKMLQSLSLGMFKYGHLMIVISQVTAAPKIDPYAKGPHREGEFSGGNALAHFNDFTFEYQPTYAGDYIFDSPTGKFNDGKSTPIGRWTKIKLIKSAVEASKYQTIKIPIKYGRKPSGIWVEYEILDLMKAWDMIKVGGAGWMTFDPATVAEIKEKCGFDMPEKVQGDKNMLSILEENPKVTEHLVKKFRDLITT
jgi:RecA/RadA recombinase